MYLTTCARLDIAFFVNLLARYSSDPTRRHWNGIKHILRYLKGTSDTGLVTPLTWHTVSSESVFFFLFFFFFFLFFFFFFLFFSFFSFFFLFTINL